MTHFFQAKKRFGQNFLVDQAAIAAIIKQINPTKSENIVEIGPGLGALTQPLTAAAGKITVIELDKGLIAGLLANPQLNVIAADVLSVNFHQLGEQLGGQLRVVGNLPYNISSPILFHLLEFAADIIDQHFMLQKEVVERLLATPHSSAYGRLSVMLQWRYYMEHIITVPPQSFRPPPKVTSAVIRMQPKPTYAALDVKCFSEVVKVAFSQRRKLLRHSLGKWLTEQQLSLDFNLQRRAEEVSVDEYIALTQQIMQLRPNQCAG